MKLPGAVGGVAVDDKHLQAGMRLPGWRSGACRTLPALPATLRDAGLLCGVVQAYTSDNAKRPSRRAGSSSKNGSGIFIPKPFPEHGACGLLKHGLRSRKSSKLFSGFHSGCVAPRCQNQNRSAILMHLPERGGWTQITSTLRSNATRSTAAIDSALHCCAADASAAFSGDDAHPASPMQPARTIENRSNDMAASLLDIAGFPPAGPCLPVPMRQGGV